MTEHNFDNFSQLFNKWQKNIINFTLKRNLANKEIEKYIRSIQIIDSEIWKSLFTAKEFYNKKLHNYNQKIKRIKQKENELKELLEYVEREKNSYRRDQNR